MITRRDFVAGLSVALATTKLGAASRPRIVGVWSGAVTGGSATIKVLTSAPGVPIDVRLTPDVATLAAQVVVSDAQGVATVVLTGLQPRTRYRYALTAPEQPAVEGSFRTFADGPFSFRVAFGSCAATGSTSRVFLAMRQLEPDLFVHLGDLHYENIAQNELTRFRTSFARVLASPTQGVLLRSVPIAYTWDDHDYGPNNSDRTSPSRPAALQAYRRFVPHYPLADGQGSTIHQAFTVGRVRFVMTDSRSARSPDNGPDTRRTMLGPAQIEWFERQLDAARAAPLVVWVNTVPWITKGDESTGDGWARYARERSHLADLIVRFGLTDRLVMLSGDAHMLAMDDGTYSQYSTLPGAPRRGFRIVHAAPMDRWPSYKGGPYSHPAVARNGQFGVMDVADSGRQVSVVLRGMRGGVEVPGMQLTLTV